MLASATKKLSSHVPPAFIDMNFVLWLVASAVQVAIGLIGILAINGEFARKHYRAMICTFVGLSAVGIGAGGWAFVRAERSEAVAEELTKRVLYEVKGSPEGYLRVIPDVHEISQSKAENGEVGIQVYNPTEFPIVDAHIGTTGSFNTSIPHYSRAIGDVHPKGGMTLTSLRLPVDKNYTTGLYLSISCRASVQFAEVYVTWDGEHWTSATELRRRVGGVEELVMPLPDNFEMKKKPPKGLAD